MMAAWLVVIEYKLHIVQGSVRGWRGCQPNCSSVAAGRRPALAHFRQRSRLARSCTKVVGGCFMAARSTSLGVLHRAHWISSHGKPPLTAWSIVGDRSIGSPSRPHPFVPTLAEQPVGLL